MKVVKPKKRMQKVKEIEKIDMQTKNKKA